MRPLYLLRVQYTALPSKGLVAQALESFPVNRENLQGRPMQGQVCTEFKDGRGLLDAARLRDPPSEPRLHPPPLPSLGISGVTHQRPHLQIEAGKTHFGRLLRV